MAREASLRSPPAHDGEHSAKVDPAPRAVRRQTATYNWRAVSLTYGKRILELFEARGPDL